MTLQSAGKVWCRFSARVFKKRAKLSLRATFAPRPPAVALVFSVMVVSEWYFYGAAGVFSLSL